MPGSVPYTNALVAIINKAVVILPQLGFCVYLLPASSIPTSSPVHKTAKGRECHHRIAAREDSVNYKWLPCTGGVMLVDFSLKEWEAFSPLVVKEKVPTQMTYEGFVICE